MMKKLICMLMTMLTVFMMAIPTYAARAGSITVSNAVEGQTYTVYRIFDLESFDHENNKYSYKVNDTWEAWAKSQNTYLTVDESGYIQWNEGADQVEFAKEALDYAKKNNITNQGTQVAGVEPVTFSYLRLGYYLLDSSLGALCSLDTLNPDVVIEEKNEEPTVIKEVKEDSSGSYCETNGAEIGQKMQFRTTITVQAGAENYILHDRMSEGLTFDTISSVTVDGKNLDTSAYTIVDDLTDNCTFEIRFDNKYLSTLAPGTQLIVEYTAVLNPDAIVGESGNSNETWMDYGDNNSTAHDITKTYTWSADVFKFTMENNIKKPLAYTCFTLSKDADGNNPISFIKSENPMIYKVDENGDTSYIVTDDTGEFSIEGLNEGVYYLTEIQAPVGYNELHAPVVIVISSEESGEENNKSRSVELKVRNEENEDITVTVVEIENKTSVELPQTGDMGTKLFYMIGGFMFVSILATFAVRRRVHGER